VRRERRDVVVLHRLGLVRELGPGVAVGRPEGHEPLGDLRREGGATDLGHRPADELGEVDEVAADVGERAGAGGAAVAPGHGCPRAARVVAPVASVEVGDLAELVADEVADRGDGRLTAIDEAGARDEVRVGGGRGGHGLRVDEGVGQGLLAQDVLACGEELFDELAVKGIGDDDADDLDVVGLEQRPPVGPGPFVAVARGGVRGDRLIRVDDGRVLDGGKRWVEKRWRGAPSCTVGAAGHAGADHCDTDGCGHPGSPVQQRDMI